MKWSNELTEEVIDELTRVKGIGRWTAEMFLIFSLGREDVFSLGDPGLRKVLCQLYGLRNSSERRIRKITETWSPYRSWGSRVLWDVVDG